MTWMDARSKCISMNSRLVEVQTGEQYNEVNEGNGHLYKGQTTILIKVE